MSIDNRDWSVGYSGAPTQEQIDHWESIKGTVSEVYPLLYISGYPDDGVIARMRELGVSYMISTTISPPPPLIHLWIYRVPFVDNATELPNDKHLIEAVHTGVIALMSGKPVLVHCAYGLNRSALIAARIINEFSGLGGKEILKIIRERRPGVLHNPIYAEYVANLKGIDKI